MATNNTPIDNTRFNKLKAEGKKEKNKDSIKRFPKIENDGQKRKKNPLEEDLPTSAPSPFTQTNIPSRVEIVQETHSSTPIQEITMPLVSQIQLMKDRGITKTHFFIESKVFGEIEVSLTMYDSAPHSFHMQLYGSEQLQKLSQLHQNALEQNIKSNVPKIILHIAPPLLRKKDRFTTSTNKKIAKSEKPLYSKVNRSQNT